MESTQAGNGYIVRLSRGEELLQSLQTFCQMTNITSGWIWGIGGAQHAKLSYYDLTKKEYVTRECTGPLEVTNLTGNVTQQEGSTVFHLHATLGTTEYAAVAGHLNHLVVGGTLELYLVPFERAINRHKDTETGLSLLSLS